MRSSCPSSVTSTSCISLLADRNQTASATPKHNHMPQVRARFLGANLGPPEEQKLANHHARVSRCLSYYLSIRPETKAKYRVQKTKPADDLRRSIRGRPKGQKR